MDSVNISSCLICLGSLEFPRNLCDANYKKLLELLCLLLGFQVEIQGGVFNICRTCEGKLVWVDEFKDLCVKSLAKFKNSDCKKEFVELNIQNKVVTDDTVSELESEDEIRKRPKKRKKHIVIKRSPRNLRKPKFDCKDSPNDVVSQHTVKDLDNSKPSNQINEDLPHTNANISAFDDDPPFLSDEDSDYRPQKSDSDSDYRANKLSRERKKTILKSPSKRGPKPKTKIKKVPKAANIKRNRKYSTQYSEAEVLQAIAEYESYMTDMKNRKCIHCDYEAPNAKSLRMHMTFKHKEEFICWCKHCNIQTEDLQVHRDSVRCFEERCKFCKKVCPSKKNFPQHLRSHCLKVKENKPLEEARWKICDQYPKDQVLQAIAISTKYMTDLKNRTCLYCNYVATTAKTLTVHLRFGHKEYFDTWCSRCNIQTDNLKTHMDTTKCFENICSLCNKKFTKINRLTRHLESHCRDVFKKLDENIDWDDDIIPQFEDLPSVGIPATPDVTASITDGDNSDQLPIQNLNHSNLRTSNLENENIPLKKDNLKDDSAVSDVDLSATPSSEDSDDEDGNIRDKRLKNRPLKQFHQKKVQRAITESMKSFYTNRKCIKCGFLTSNSKCLGAHMASHKNLKDKWCSRCNTLVGNLTKHWIGHKNDILKCIFCDKSSESIDNLKDHLKRHCRSHTLDLKGKWFSCKICPASFPEEQHLKDHKCLEVNAFVVCVLCKKRVRNLRIHMAQRHKSLDLNLKPKNKADALRKRLCPICGKTFMVSYLAAHMYTHTGEMPYKCSYCGKGFAIMSILRSHEKRHSGEKPFVCHICGKGFVTSSEHRSHIQIHEGGPVQCTICNKEFSRPGVLKLHMRRHTGENQFYCVHCGISFHRKSLLLNHMRRHNNERPFKCSFCEKDFRDPSTLKKHEHIHKGIKPYKCSICSFSCTQSQGLSLHMKQHPEDAPQADRPYKCFFCYRQFNTNAMLMSHTNNHHRDSTR